MKKILLCFYLFWSCILIMGCSKNGDCNSIDGDYISDTNLEEEKEEDINNHLEKSAEEGITAKVKENPPENTVTDNEYALISPEGDTLATRINPPENYKRMQEDEKSFTAFMRNLILKADGSPILLYNGEEKSNQSDHVAVFDIEIGDKDLQQCADSIIRVYAEYYWSIGEYDKIAFHLTNNFLMEYLKWRDGYRLSVSGNDTSWIKSAEYDDTYDNFLAYLEIVFMYAGTISLNSEGIDINTEDIEPGDMFIKGGSPGHCVLVIDMVENNKGEKAFLLAQGYMPAQEFHVLINPLHEDDPWYYAEELTYPVKTPQWTFEEKSLKRWFK